MKLCLKFPQFRHPDYLENYLSPAQIVDWRVFNRMHPFGDDVILFAIARLTAMFFNVNRGKDSPPMEADEFINRTDTKELWDEIEKSIEESRKQAQMTAEQRAEVDKKLVDAFIASRQAAMGKARKAKRPTKKEPTGGGKKERKPRRITRRR